MLKKNEGIWHQRNPKGQPFGFFKGRLWHRSIFSRGVKVLEVWKFLGLKMSPILRPQNRLILDSRQVPANRYLSTCIVHGICTPFKTTLLILKTSSLEFTLHCGLDFNLQLQPSRCRSGLLPRTPRLLASGRSRVSSPVDPKVTTLIHYSWAWQPWTINSWHAHTWTLKALRATGTFVHHKIWNSFINLFYISDLWASPAVSSLHRLKSLQLQLAGDGPWCQVCSSGQPQQTPTAKLAIWGCHQAREDREEITWTLTSREVHFCGLLKDSRRRLLSLLFVLCWHRGDKKSWRFFRSTTCHQAFSSSLHACQTTCSLIRKVPITKKLWRKRRLSWIQSWYKMRWAPWCSRDFPPVTASR